MQSQAPEYAGNTALAPASDPRTLAALGGEPLASANGSVTSPPATPAALPPRLPGTPELAKDGSYVFTGGGIELAVSPRHAGAAVRLSLDGKNVLAPPTFVVPEPLDAQLEGSTLVLKSAGGELTKRYRLDTSRRAVELTYTLRSTSGDPVRTAAADLHRVPSGSGLSFFPGEQRLLAGSTLKLDVRQRVVWFAHEQSREPKLGEAFVPAAEDWVATVNEGVLLVKTFGGVRATLVVRSAYDEHTKQRPWVELGGQAAFELAPGASATWSVRWFLRRLPEGLVATAGNPELLGFVRGVIQ